MKKMMIKSLAVFMIIGAFAIVSFAQSNNKRVQFAKGKTSAVERFTLPADDGITYILGVKQWNLMKFRVTAVDLQGNDAQGLTVKLTKLGNEDDVLAEASVGEEVEYQFINSGGDYVITVMNESGKKAKIKLDVSINK